MLLSHLRKLSFYLLLFIIYCFKLGKEVRNLHFLLCYIYKNISEYRGGDYKLAKHSAPVTNLFFHKFGALFGFCFKRNKQERNNKYLNSQKNFLHTSLKFKRRKEKNKLCMSKILK